MSDTIPLHLLASEDAESFGLLKELVLSLLRPRCFMVPTMEHGQKPAWAKKFVMKIANFLSVTFVEAAVSNACDTGDAEQVVTLTARLVYAMWRQVGDDKLREGLTRVADLTDQAFAEGHPDEPSVRRSQHQTSSNHPSPPPRAEPRHDESSSPTRDPTAASLDRFLDAFQAMQRQQQDFLASVLRVQSAASPSAVLVEKPKAVHATRGPNLAPWLEDAGLTSPLSRLPVYSWHADDPDLSVLRTAISALARAVLRIVDIGAEAYRRQLSSEFTSRGRHVDIRTAAALHAALLSGEGAALLALAEATIIVDPDLPTWAYERILIARIAPAPTKPDEHRRVATGAANLSVAHSLLPARADKTSRSPQDRPKAKETADDQQHDNGSSPAPRPPRRFH